MKKTMCLAVIVLAGVSAGLAQGAGTGNMALENTMLRQRLDQLDKEIQDLRQGSSLQKDSTVTKAPVWSKLDIQLYGYLKLDAAYDTSRINTGDYAKWVDSITPNSDDDQFNMTANETRLGFMITGPKSNGLVTSGKVEVDFYGAGAGENKAGIMMRHAFIKLDWPDYRFSIIAGQTSDVISPLVPTTINYSVAWWAGNIGYRRPQIRFTKEVSLNSNVDLKFEGALARTIGRDTPFVAGTTDSGEDAGFPTLQGRVSVSMPIIPDRTSTFGFSAHTGKEEFDLNANGHSKDFKTWSLNLDVTQPICEKVSLKGELFKGENLDAYLGGIGQGVNMTTYKEIDSSGGWIAASLGPWNNKQFNVGISIDDPDNGDLNSTTENKSYNRSIFGNIIYSLNSQTDIGFELSRWDTDYIGAPDEDSLRAQFAVKYKF